VRWHPRGVLPAVFSSTLSYWHLNDDVIEPVQDFGLNAAVDPLDQADIDEPARPVPGPGRLARRFNGSGALYGAANDAAVRAAMLGEWTIQVCFRRAFATSAVRTLFSYGGLGTTSSAENILVDIRVTTGDAIEIRTQSGTNSNATVTPGSASYIVPFGEWNLIAVRKEDAGGGLYRYRLFVNGREMGVSAGITAPTGGGNAEATIGAIRGASAPAQPWVGDIAFVKFDSAQLTDDTIERDFERLIGVSFEVRDDYALEIEDGNGDRQEMTDLYDVDWVKGFGLSQSRSNDVLATMSVDMLGSIGRLALHQLRTESRANLTDETDPTSYDPLVDFDREIELWFAQVPRNIRAYPDELQSRYLGSIDVNDEDPVAVRLETRDGSSVLVDTVAEQLVSYGDNGGSVDMEEAAQAFLDDNDNSTSNDSQPFITPRPGSYDPITLYLRDTRNLMLPQSTAGGPSTGWAIAAGGLKREPIITGLRELFGQLAWNVSYLFDQVAEAWRVAGYEPRREQQHPSHVLDPDRILEIRPFRRDTRLSRTTFVGRYGSSETTLPVPAALPSGFTGTQAVGWFDLDGRGQRSTAFYRYTEDAAHTAGRRRRYFEFQESSASQVDTVDEMQRMVLGVASDLRDPEIAASIRMPLSMSLELDDLQRLLPNVLSTADQYLATQEMMHAGGERSETSIGVGGKARAGFKRWWELEARPGVGKPGVLDPNDAALIRVRGDETVSMVNLIDFTDYMAGGRFLQVKNNDFARYTKLLLNPPDAWRIEQTRLGSPGPLVWPDDLYADNTIQVQGGYSVRFLVDTSVNIDISNFRSAFLTSDDIPLDEGQPVALEFTWHPDDAVGDTVVQVRLQWLDRFRTSTGTDAFDGSIPAGWGIGNDFPIPGDWIKDRFVRIMPPSNTRFVKIQIGTLTTTTFREINIDSVSLARSTRLSERFNFSSTPPTTTAAGAWQQLDTSDAVVGDPFGIQTDIDSSDARFTILEGGRYRAVINDTIAATAGSLAQVGVGINGSTPASGNASMWFPIVSGPFGQSLVEFTAEAGDVVRLYFRTDESGGGSEFFGLPFLEQVSDSA
jgi:hypothetical protein